MSMIRGVEPEGVLFGKPVSAFPDHALAVGLPHAEIFSMKRFLIVIGVVTAVVLGAGTVTAQTIIPPGTSPLNPPPPPPLPAPKIQVPVVPKMDELPERNYVPAPRPSFSDRITTCLEEGAAAGLGPADRETYARACAQSQ